MPRRSRPSSSTASATSALRWASSALFYLTDSIRFDDVFAAAPALAETNLSFLWTDWNAANLIGVLLFIGAMGKSAQLILHTWLPDAMEGPTPVSALIHAATMVTAGVFLVCRMSPLYEYAPQATAFITVIGATTAFFAATVGPGAERHQAGDRLFDLSQLGYMFVAAGVGVYPVAMFHLFTHAFFKAMLFLGRRLGHPRHPPRTGHAQLWRAAQEDPADLLGDDDRHAGHHRRRHPADPFGFAGFLSKDAVIESAWVGSSYAFWLLVSRPASPASIPGG
jgi:NADH-quinone oxidoreductase subunit L